MGTGWSSSTQSATYSMPASASRSMVSSVSVRPGFPSRAARPVKALMAAMVSRIAVAWSATRCMGCCTCPWPMNSQPASSAAWQAGAYSWQAVPFTASVALSRRAFNTSRKRQKPTRMPYSCQHQLGMSGSSG